MRLGKGEIDSQTALELSTLTKNWLDAIYTHQEYDLKLAAQGGGAEQQIHITGRLPPLPGTNVIMDDTAVGLNGHDGHPAIDHEPANGATVAPSLPQEPEPLANPLELQTNTSNGT